MNYIIISHVDTAVRGGKSDGIFVANSVDIDQAFSRIAALPRRVLTSVDAILESLQLQNARSYRRPTLLCRKLKGHLAHKTPPAEDGPGRQQIAKFAADAVEPRWRSARTGQI